MPEGPEHNNPSESEVEAQKEKLLERAELIGRVFSVITGTARKFNSLYTRIWNSLGVSTVINTPITIEQLRFTLAMSNHPTVDNLLEKIKTGEVTAKNFSPAVLKEAAVLHGLKVLDLGCGPEPTFTRSARRLGADVYTVDVIPANLFDLWNPAEGKEGWLEQLKTDSPREHNITLQLMKEFEETKKLEAEKHVEIDLNDPDAITKILQQTGGEFDFVTAAQIESGFMYQGREIYPPHNLRESAMKLLKKNGVYFHPQGFGERLEIKN